MADRATVKLGETSTGVGQVELERAAETRAVLRCRGCGYQPGGTHTTGCAEGAGEIDDRCCDMSVAGRPDSALSPPYPVSPTPADLVS